MEYYNPFFSQRVMKVVCRVLSSSVVGCLVGRVSSVSVSWVAGRRFLVVVVSSRVGADGRWVV